jgi:methyl-accepting chemotaxis protein
MAAQSPPASPAASSGLDAQLAAQVKDLAQRLRERGATNGARRLEVVVQQFEYFTVEGASQYIQKDAILDELEGRSHWFLTILRGARNLLSIAPIAFTWWALHLAADAYQRDLNDPHFANDLYQPFLLLWQEGFHGNHGSVIPFSAAAGLDALLLSVLVLLIVLVIPFFEKRHRERMHDSLRDDIDPTKDFDRTIDALLVALGQAGANAHLADADIAKLSNAIQNAIQTTLNRLLLSYDRVAEEARKFVEDTHKQTAALVKNFDDDLVVFNSDVKLLTGDLQKMDKHLGDYSQKLTDLTTASSKLANSSSDLAQNARQMADSAQKSSQASQGISDRLKDLNDTQQEIVKTQKDVVQDLATTQQKIVQDVTASQKTIVDKIADSQKAVVDELTGAADIVEKSGQYTRDSARELNRVATNLEQLTRADFQAMTDGVKRANQDLVREVQQISGAVQGMINGLSQINGQLYQTTQGLSAAAQELAKASGVRKKRRFLFW